MSSIGTTASLQIDTVVFATDFSPASYNAGLYSSAFSKLLSTNLAIVHGFTLSQAALEVEAEWGDQSRQRLDLKHELSLVAELLPAGRGVTKRILLEGDPTEVVPLFARQQHPSLIVLGTHGRGSIDRLILGSTAEGILRHMSGPALTVGPNVANLPAGDLRFRRILYATDCSEQAAHAAPVALALAEGLVADLHVLNVTPDGQAADTKQLQKLQQHFRAALAATVPGIAQQISTPQTFVSVGDPQKEILRHIEENHIDLLVLGLRRSGHLGMQNRTSGAFPIIVSARCPVITVAAGPVVRN